MDGQKRLGSWWHPIIWCFLVSLASAALEALAYFSTSTAQTAMPFTELAQRFSGSTTTLFGTTLLLWMLSYVLMVWLGGVRSGLALFFTLSSFALYGFFVQSLDLVSSYTTKYVEDRALLLKVFLGMAIILTGSTSLVLAKLLRKRNPAPLNPRWFTNLLLLLIGAVLAIWLKSIRFPQSGETTFWFLFALLALALLPIAWWLGRTPTRLTILLVTIALLVFAPLPWAIVTPPPTQQPPSQPAQAGRPVKHIVLLTVDTLRQDALGFYNGNPNSTPRLDQFAKDAVRFNNAFSAAPWTYPALTSILTGLSPRVHLLSDGLQTMSDKVPTMAESLEKAGYRTAAFGFNHFLVPRSKLNRGFQQYIWFPSQSVPIKDFEIGITHQLLMLGRTRIVNAENLTDYAAQWSKENAQNDTFLWVHYLDPHMPYAPFQDYLPTDPEQRAMGSFFWDVKSARGGSVARTAKERAWARSLYDGEVRYVDTQIGRLLDNLRQLGTYDDSLLIFTSDHGEEFWDHDQFEHGHTLFNELIRVPLAIKLPGSHQNAAVNSYVSTRAIMPTILDLCAVPPKSPQGLMAPISPLLRVPSENIQEQPITTGSSIFGEPLEGIIFDHMKYVRGELTGTELLFNLDQDPRENNAIAGQDQANLTKGRQLLEAATAADTLVREQLGITKDAKDQLNNQDVQSLKALGYL